MIQLGTDPFCTIFANSELCDQVPSGDLGGIDKVRT